MSGFMDIKTGNWTVIAMLVSLVAALVGGAFTLYHTMSGPEYGLENQEKILKCVGPEGCGYTESVSIEKFNEMKDKANQALLADLASTDPQKEAILRKLMEDPFADSVGGLTLPNWGSAQFPLTCPKCGKATLRSAMKCQKCGEVFVPFDERGMFDDKCPKCGFSAAEELRKKEAEERRANR